MTRRVSKLTMAGFRGATKPTTIEFDTTKPVVLIFGENGTGKSTIADAFDFICNRSLGSLVNYSLGEPAKKHIASLGHDPSDVTVTLESGSKKWSARMGKDSPAVSPQEELPDARILRRRAILSLIETAPKQRFEALKTFIALPSIEKCEAALRDAFNTTNAIVNELVRATDQAENELDRLWVAEGKPGESAFGWANAEANKDLSQLWANLTQINTLLQSYQEIENALTTLDQALADESNARQAYHATEARLQQAEARTVLQSAQLLNLLRDAKAYVAEKNALTECPVCEQKVNPHELGRKLGHRIGEMEELAAITATTATEQKKMEDKRIVASQARQDFCRKASALAGNLKVCSLDEITALKLDWNDFTAILGTAQQSDVLEEQARRFWTAVAASRPGLEARREADQKSVYQHNALAGHVETLREKRGLAIVQQKLLEDLRAALDIVMQQRKDYVEEILADISTEVQTLYSTLHPNERIGRVKFYLKPNAIGSLEFDAQFQDAMKLPPQAYYSESHLDTLGICVFLALAKYFRTDNTVVVLDDVLTSVDGPHLDRFMTLMHAQAQHFGQVILTTHYRPWRDRYRWAKGSMASTQVIELGPWSLENGLQTGEFLTAVDELKAALTSSRFDRQVAASKAGIVLESLLDFITLKYRCSIPRNARNEYTLGDLVGGVDSKLGKVLCCHKPNIAGGPKTEVPLKPLIDAAAASQWIRNSVGCHFNSLGSEVYDSEVRDFGAAVLTLAAHLICDTCRTLPTRRPAGLYWQCKCGQLELYPLVYPGADLRTVDDEES